MQDFGKLFMETKEDFIIYEGKKLFVADKFPIKNGDVLKVNIESTRSDCRQGATIDITRWCEINGEVIKKGKGLRIQFWEDTFEKNMKLKVYTKQDYVYVYNMYEVKYSYLVADEFGNLVNKEKTRLDWGHNRAAMIVEEIENGRRYRCSDIKADGNFDNIVFTVQRVNPLETC